MAVRYFDYKTYEKIGRPDLNSKIFYINKETNEKVYGYVSQVEYGNKRGVKLKIKPYKK